MKRARTYEQIKDLIDHCKAGRLFDVQNWISAGKPVNPPVIAEKKNRRRSPLQIAIDCGFHSLVQVLLEAGAITEEPRYSPLEHALTKRRLDLVQLLERHGAGIRSVDMKSVFDTWDPGIIEFFIRKGADVERSNPLAYALSYRIRTALGIFKRYKNCFLSFQEQANIALRYHCKEGNLKWVSLMLWAGADPYAKGPDSPDSEPDFEWDRNALELAAEYEHYDVFKLKAIRLDPKHPDCQELLQLACYADKSDFLRELLDKGFNPNDSGNSGSSLIQSLLQSIAWSVSPYSRGPNKNIDTPRSREKIKMIHLLVKCGAKWIPKNQTEINDARRSLLRMSPDYTVEFIWIMSKFNGCSREHAEQLMRTPSIRALVSKYHSRIDELMETFQPANNPISSTEEER
jgi:hypothetical protein